MNNYAKQASEEYNSATKTVRRAGINGKPFWNTNSTQFTFVPQLQFPTIPNTDYYIYTATDCNGKLHTFESKTPIADLSPIWKDIPTGMVTLKVEAMSKREELFTAGIRTFYKATPFPGREAYPERARSFKDCANLAFLFVFENNITQYWLKHGVPDPEYYHNAYPSKTIRSLIRAMIAYAELEPERASDAIKIATTSADYLLSITYPESSPLHGLPPTYSFKGLNKEIVDANAPAAGRRKDTVMMIYPANVGYAYLALEKVTGDTKYFEGAKAIADYYKANVLPNGSWYLLVNEKTGKPEGENCCLEAELLDFLNEYYNRTKDEEFKVLENNYFNHIMKTALELYNFEGQFEDVSLTSNYVNLTHFVADYLIGYISKNHKDDPDMMSEAKALMRFVEDQFVVWGKHAPWLPHITDDSYYPAGLEQYGWYVPIDSSTAIIMQAFLDLYEATGDSLLLQKALTLGDQLTKMQNPETGVIPTHWMKKDCIYKLENFWLNCHIATAFRMLNLAKLMGEM